MRTKFWSLFAALLLVLTQVAPAAAQGGIPVTRISFAPGAISATRTGTLTMGDMDRYVLKANKGQTMQVSVSSYADNVILIIFGKDGTVLISDHADAGSWSGVLPATQDYYIDVRAIDGTSANYTLTVTIPPNRPTPPKPVPPKPQPVTQRINFAPGAVSATVNGTVTPGRPDRWVLKALARQYMTVTTNSREQAIGISVVGADGTVLQSPMGGLPSFSGVLPSTQDYYITVQIQGQGFAGYQMTVVVDPVVY